MPPRNSSNSSTGASEPTMPSSLLALLPLELRLALLHESLDPLVDVLGRRDEPERQGLELRRRVQTHATSAVQQDLRELHRDRGAFRKGLRERPCLRLEGLVLDDLGEKTNTRRRIRVEPRSEHHELLGLRLPEDANEPLASPCTGHEAQADLRLSELHALRRDTEVAGESEFEPASERVAVQGRDRGLRKVRDAVHDLFRAPREAPDLEGLRNVAEPRHVGSRAQPP